MHTLTGPVDFNIISVSNERPERIFLEAHLRQLEAQERMVEELRRAIKREIGRVRKQLE